jgi:hypothetical protein
MVTSPLNLLEVTSAQGGRECHHKGGAKITATASPSWLITTCLLFYFSEFIHPVDRVSLCVLLPLPFNMALEVLIIAIR